MTASTAPTELTIRSQARLSMRSGGAVGWTGAFAGTSTRTESVCVLIVPPCFEGRPTASSQTVPWMVLSTIVSLLMIDQRFGPTRRMFIVSTGGRGPTEKK